MRRVLLHLFAMSMGYLTNLPFFKKSVILKKEAVFVTGKMDRFFQVVDDLYSKFEIPKIYPVPLMAIAKGLGYRVDFFEVTPENEHISGAVYYNEKQIWLNPGEIAQRRNFTLAHELGHILLRHDKDVSDGREYDTRKNITNPEKKDKREVDANEFAAELLMPEDAFKNVWRKTRSIVELSDFFDVSIAATNARMEKLGLRYDYERK